MARCYSHLYYELPNLTTKVNSFSDSNEMCYYLYVITGILLLVCCYWCVITGVLLLVCSVNWYITRCHLQTGILCCRFFNEFLLANERQVSREIRDEYVDTMSKIYYSYFKGYMSRLSKLQARIYDLFYMTP